MISVWLKLLSPILYLIITSINSFVTVLLHEISQRDSVTNSNVRGLPEWPEVSDPSSKVESCSFGVRWPTEERVNYYFRVDSGRFNFRALCSDSNSNDMFMYMALVVVMPEALKAIYWHLWCCFDLNQKLRVVPFNSRLVIPTGDALQKNPMMSLSQIGEYTILNIKVPHISSFSESTLHTIYIRPHAPKIPTEDDSRSLFLVNVPVDSTAAHLRSVFQSLIGAGRFVSATFENESLAQDSSKDPNPSVQNGKKRKRENDPDEQTHQDLPLVWDRRLRRSGSSAVVVLVDVKSMEKTLKVIKKMHNRRISSKDTNLDWPVWSNGISNVPSLGSARYLTHQKMCFPNKHELQLNIDAYMSSFNLREETQREQKKKAKNIPDADGFITVSRGGRVAPAKRETVELKKALMEERESKKREQMQKAGFYRFQGREKRKEEAEELVRRFEEDRKKVQALRDRKGKSGFRPEN